jgi:hypothetical protein
VTSGNPQLVADTKIEWKLTVRVQPDGQPAFEADVDGLFGQLGGPVVGGSLTVLYDPDDHAKVVIDSSVDGQLDAKANEIAAQLAKSGRAADPAAIAAALKQAGAGDPSALRAALGAPSGDVATVVGGPTQDDGHADPIELLATLEELHDKGAIDDAHYEAQKRRVLGE